MKDNNGKITTINFQEIPLRTVLDSFAKGFVAPEGKKVVSHEAFLDTNKCVVLYKLYVEEPKESPSLVILPE